MDPWSILRALWLFLPAYVANMSPVFSAKLMPWWKAPIDGGRMHRDGGRVLGDGKTWRGLVGGAVAGGATAVAMALLSVALQPSWLDGWDFGRTPYCDGGPIGQDCIAEDDESVGSITFMQQSVGLGPIFVFGAIVGGLALVGDAAESFLKRRRGMERGAAWIPFDQLDFVVFGLLGMAAGAPLLADGWVREALLGDWLVLATIIVGTIGLHLLVNRIGYWLKLKEVPW